MPYDPEPNPALGRKPDSGFESKRLAFHASREVRHTAIWVHAGASRQPEPPGLRVRAQLPCPRARRPRHGAGQLPAPTPRAAGLVHRRGRLGPAGAAAAPVPRPHQPELGDRKRQVASIYVWVQGTLDEHYFAPRPIEATQTAQVQEAWKARRNSI